MPIKDNSLFSYNKNILKYYVNKSKHKDLLNDNSTQILLNLIKKKIPDHEVYCNRLIKEFRLIKKFKFENVFVQVGEILDLAGNIPHIIRGSAGSCLLCYFMNITNIDPIKEKITLSRFMHKKRKSIPDIDIDFPSHLRDNIYKKIFQNWNNNVARISNHIMYGEKSAYREAIRKMGHRKFVPRNYDLGKIFKKDDDIQKVHQIAKDLNGTFRCYSLHCGGIVIFKDKIPEKYFLQNYKLNNGVEGTQIKLNKIQTENNGFIKIDILSNRGLSQLMSISNKNVSDYPSDRLIWNSLVEDDNIGLTHSESRTMMKIFKTMKPTTIKEIAIGLALIRPAASKNYQKADFLRDYSIYKKGRRDYIIFDDDATGFIKKLFKCEDYVADNYRRAFSKNKKKEIQEFKKKFFEIEKNPAKREIIIERLEQLKYYSFCKSHAYSYASLVYALAYEKYYNPKKFWLSTLNNCNSSYRRWVHFRKASEAGIQLCFGKKPFRLNNNKLIPTKEEKDIETCPFKQYFKYGYWISKEFLPNMYYYEYWKDITKYHKNLKNIITKDNKIKYASFKGLIATGRGCKKENEKGYITFITIGVDNNKFIDLVLYGYHKVSSMAIIKGYGKVKVSGECKFIDVIKFEKVYV